MLFTENLATVECQGERSGISEHCTALLGRKVILKPPSTSAIPEDRQNMRATNVKARLKKLNINLPLEKMMPK